MSLVVADRKPVIAVEYLDDLTAITAAKRDLAAYGFVSHFADRKLELLRIGDAALTATSADHAGVGAMVRRGLGWTTLALLAVAVIFVALGLMRRKPGL